MEKHKTIYFFNYWFPKKIDFVLEITLQWAYMLWKNNLNKKYVYNPYLQIERLQSNLEEGLYKSFSLSTSLLGKINIILPLTSKNEYTHW